MDPLALARFAWLGLWELPQTTLGVLTYVGLRALGDLEEVEWTEGRVVVRCRSVGVSLGWFVFWTRQPHPVFTHDDRIRAHELGHAVQSRWLGPLYLPVVGVPSVARVVYAYVYHRRTGRRWTGYYDGWPEKQADRLGGVVR
ncbi:MAG: hypothetical protein H6733_08770 [Alphaproteobacteria bacterium]|nr:hypothetical protein [Alphaproteobacteria bacterium]